MTATAKWFCCDADNNTISTQQCRNNMKLEDHHNSKLSSQDNLDKIRGNDASLTWLKIHCTNQRENGNTFLANFLKLFMP